jgi:hypothetical protein
MSQAVSRRPLTAKVWEIRFQCERTKRQKNERKKERQPLKVGSNSTEDLRKFRLCYRNWGCSIAGQFLEHRIRKINVGKISSTNFKYIKV